MKGSPALILLTVISACGDETISGYIDRSQVFSLEGDPAMSVSFPRRGRVHGHGLCGEWKARQAAPYPWIEIGPVPGTEASCADFEAEKRFRDALANMRIAEVSGQFLILSGENGEEMVFLGGTQGN
ncbi:MAG: META domain-containing protein [Pseudomonadota bacterium]